MQTIEFDSYVENGVIPIPLRYKDIAVRSVRVVVIPRDEVQEISQNTTKEKRLYSLDVDMSGFTFDRDELNER